MSDLRLMETGENLLGEEEEPRDPTRTYPWKAEEEDELATYLTDKATAFADFVRSSRYYRWARKSWSFYYSQVYDAGARDGIGVVPLGDEGELVGAQVNHHRNLIRHIYNMVTRDRPALATRARNTDLKSIRQADLGLGLVEYYLRQENAENYTNCAAEHAAVVGEGYVMLTWDPAKGPETDADPVAMTMMHQGDLSFSCPVWWNVIRDLGVRDWSKHQWMGVRRSANKWELLAQFPEKEEAILSAESWLDVPTEEGDQPFDELENLLESDEVEIYEFWHKRSMAMPRGRNVLLCGGEVLLDLDMPYRDIPLHRVTAAELLHTPFGYTPAFDLIGIQELINMVISTIATIVNAFGVPTIWGQPGDPISPENIAGGMLLLKSRHKPELLEFSKVPPELFQLLDMLTRHAEIIAGVDQITRGAPDEHVRSGAYAALLQAQSVQSSNSFFASYNRMMESVGTSMLRILRDFAQEPRIAAIVGKHNRQYMKHFTGDDLELVDRVTVETTNPLFNTISGKIEFAQMLLGTTDASGNPLIKTPEQVIEVFKTGQVEALTEAVTAQLSAIREENEELLDGVEVAPPMPEDNHILHIREHSSIFATKEARNDPNLRASVMAHNQGHILLLMTDPNAQLMQQLLYDLVPPAGAQPDGVAPPPQGPGGPGMGPEEMTEPTNVGGPELDGRSMAKMPAPAEPAEAPEL